MDEITLKLSQDEINFVLKTLGELPTASNAWPLCMKIKQQAEAQLQAAETGSLVPAEDAA